MTVKFATILGVSFFAISGISTQATPLDDAVGAFKTAIHQAVPEPSKRHSEESEERYPVGYVNQLDEITSENEAKADFMENENGIRIVRQIMIAIPAQAVQMTGQALIGQIEKEEVDKETHYDDETKALLDRLTKLIATASKPSDFDALLTDLQKASEDFTGAMGPLESKDSQRLINAYHFASSWQDYLVDMSNGQVEQARSVLRDLAQTSTANLFVPRSKLLAQASGLTKPVTGSTPEIVSDIVQGIKTLDEMEPALQRLNALASGSQNMEANQAAQTLRNYVDVYTSIKAGLPTQLNMNYGQPALGNPDLSRKLLLFVMQNYLTAYTGKPPADDEKPAAFLARVVANAQEREDWPLLHQASFVQDFMSRNSTFGNMAYSNVSVEAYQVALNQEAAGQYETAVASYETALKAPVPFVPAKMIGERLAALKKDHPQEYEAAMQSPGSFQVYNQGNRDSLNLPAVPKSPHLKPSDTK